jgi:hypothetical protein
VPAAPSKDPSLKPRGEHAKTSRTPAYLRRVLSLLSEAQSRIEKELQAVDQIVRRPLPIAAKRRVNED